jgi:hypothetical protein
VFIRKASSNRTLISSLYTTLVWTLWHLSLIMWCTQKTEILDSCENLIFMLPMVITIFKNVIICSLEICSFNLQGNSTSNLINNYKLFGATYCLLVQGTDTVEMDTGSLSKTLVLIYQSTYIITLKMETACSAESMVIIYHFTCRHLRKENTLNYHTPPGYAVA